MRDKLDILLPFLRKLDPEAAHNLAILSLSLPLPAKQKDWQNQDRLAVEVGGIRFANPLGIAAGMDKNAQAFQELLKLGLGHVEVGSVTPFAQSGNPKPRLFRLEEDRAIINRMGFNNDGFNAVLQRIEMNRPTQGVLGVNIGANKKSQDFFEDFRKGIQVFAGSCDYITANVSSPNTPGLRDLQGKALIEKLLQTIAEERDKAQQRLGNKVPLFLKIAPDLNKEEAFTIADCALNYEIDALIVSNTTLARDNLKNKKFRSETGGLSGRPLFAKSTQLLAQLYRHFGKDMKLIGVGGIEDAQTAWAKMEAGATLIQCYSGLIYQGLGMVERILSGMAASTRSEGLASISDIIGRKAHEYHEWE